VPVGQAAPVPPVAEARFLSILLDPPRETLNTATDARFDAMLAAGALEEVAALGAQGLDTALPAMKSLGVPELFAHLDGDMSMDAAAEAAKQATRRFAKRQQTWFRNQFEPDYRVATQYSESLCDEIFSNIRGFLLTAQI
jgi:tRNA dimethylallyltransferase